MCTRDILSRMDSSQSEQQEVTEQENEQIKVSVLKHLPAAREILRRSIKDIFIHQTKCIYTHPLKPTPLLHNLQHNITQNVRPFKLVTLKDVQYQHSLIKQQIQSINYKNTNQELKNNLYTLYSKMTPIYARFGLSYRKSNFANVLINVAGVQLGLKNINNSQKVQKVCIRSNLLKNRSEQNNFITFDSHFQSGNLLYVYKNQDQSKQLQIDTYDLILHNDVNTKGHNQWFFFRVTNYRQQFRVRFNIVNLIKADSLFSYGMKPLVFSERVFLKQNLGWFRGGHRITYEQNCIRRQNKNKSYYTLSFEYNFDHNNDVVYFAPSIPYSYTLLNNFILNTIKDSGVYWQDVLRIKSIGNSISGNQVHLLSISTGKKEIKQSKVVWIIGRQHPGQTTSSFIVQGIIRCLLKKAMAARNSCQPSQMDGYIFKIVPMVNVDGVIHGNTRAELSGVDSNRTWSKPHKKISPIISILKKIILSTQTNLSMFLDLHSHSKKTGCFLYGNYLNHDLKVSKLYPTLVCQNDSRFCLKNCRFRGGYSTTARKVLFQELKCPYIYTVQCSMLGYMSNNRVVEYSNLDYHQMGIKLVQSYFKMQELKKNKEVLNLVPQQTHNLMQIQSAKSQSNLSDEQYTELYRIHHLRRKTKQIKNKHQQKYKHIKSMHNQQYAQQNPTRNKTLNDNPQNMPPQMENQVNKCYRLKKVQKMHPQPQHKYEPSNTKPQKHHEKENNTIQKRSYLKKVLMKEKQSVDKSLQVDFIDMSDSSHVLCVRKDNQLCVVGSSLEDDKLWVGRNEVCLQVNCRQISTSTILNKSNSSRLPKSIEFLTNNTRIIMKENAMLPQQIPNLPKYSRNLPNILRN